MKICKKCKKEVKVGEPDPCIGMLPDVISACCGHGDVSKAYVTFYTGEMFEGYPISVWSSLLEEPEEDNYEDPWDYDSD